MTDVTIRIDMDRIAEITESNLVVEFSMDKITEVDQGKDKGIGMTLGEDILEATHKCIRILEDNNRCGYGRNYRNENMKEVGVDLEKDHIQITSEGMTEVILTVGQGQEQE